MPTSDSVPEMFILLYTSYMQGVYQYQDPFAQRARAVAEQQARVQAIKEVHDREKDRLLRGQQDLQQQVYGQQVCTGLTALVFLLILMWGLIHLLRFLLGEF